MMELLKKSEFFTKYIKTKMEVYYGTKIDHNYLIISKFSEFVAGSYILGTANS